MMAKSKKNPRSIGWPDNPVVEEVRAIRAEIWKEAGGTPEGLIRLLNERHGQVKRSRRREVKKRKQTERARKR